ncbi:hypothetical protein SAY86_029432 [Trapa natans]|uniref:C2 NT-type domain-containing protein n=1 Tax=Trapa natans TaxID=22666 RepID=A0AAN7MLE4_TRANT|nr:hypothetical protein SAY86_029432 [Trapa natans]
MFRSWKSDKSKIKAVFKLSFQITQVPKMKKSALTISLMPDNAGKPTMKLQKAVVQDCTCAWENPVYETMKLIRDMKTGRIHEKIYHFIVSAGSSKAGYLGEASVDFADFAEETKPCTISVPLKFANSGAILHVTIQKMQGTDRREFEENGAPISTDSPSRSLKNQLSNCSTDDNILHKYLQDEQYDDNFQQELEHIRGELHCQVEFESVPSQNSGFAKRSSFGDTLKKNNVHRRSHTEWSLGSASDGSLGESINTIVQHVPKERLRESSDDSIEKLKDEIDSLTRQSMLSELELQSLRKQIVKETKKGQNLMMEIANLKEERDMLKTEYEELHSSTISCEDAETSEVLQIKHEEAKAQLDELRYELEHEKNLKANLRLQLQKTQDSNSELILEVADLEEVVKEKNREISSLSLKIQNFKDLEEIEKRKSKYSLNAEGKDCQQQEKSQGGYGAEISMLTQKIIELSNEIGAYKKQKEELEMHVEQLTVDCENLKKENINISTQQENVTLQEDVREQAECARCAGNIRELQAHIEKLEEVVKTQAEKLSQSLISINELESQVGGLEKEIDLQARAFEEDLEAMTQVKIEQEQRAIRSEEALRKTRWKNAVTAERLQEEFKRLSVEMNSKFDENEKMAVKAVAEANELMQKKRILEDMLQKAREEIRLITDQNEVKLRELYGQIASKAIQIEQISTQLDSTAQQLENSRNENEQISKAFSMELQTLNSELEMLRTENSELKVQCEQKKRLREETERADLEMLKQRWNTEKDDLVKKYESARKDAEEAVMDLKSMRSLKEEKENVVGNLQAEIQRLIAQQNDLKFNLSKEEIEKEKLSEEIHKLQCELKREEEITYSVKKSMDNHNHNESEGSCNNHPNSLFFNPKDVASLREKVDLLKKQIGVNSRLEGSVASSENEDCLRYIIEELQRSMDHLRHFTFSAEKSQEGVKEATDKMADGKAYLKRQEETCSKKMGQHSINIMDGNCNLNKLQIELNALKERNILMEKELKDMEERYSDISLRFAEVEGERQELVMTVRNLKSSKKS